MEKVCSVLLIGCNLPRENTSNNSLYSTLWTQHSAEFEALTIQIYNTAERMLPIALEDNQWTASLDQGENYESLPPAIIMDLDETAIDNSFYQARYILDENCQSADSITKR